MGLKGIKGKKDADVIVLQNLLNLTTKKDLAPFDHSQLKKAKQQQRRTLRDIHHQGRARIRMYLP